MKPNIYLIFLCISLSLLIACGESEKEGADRENDGAQTFNTSDPAFALMKNKCYSCHGPSPSESGRLGPIMEAIRLRYLEAYPKKKAFVAAMSEFVIHPKEEKVLLKGAYQKFGLMPAQNFNPREAEMIAEFLYDNPTETPEWFEEHWREHHKAKSNFKEKPSLATYGEQLAMATKKTLGKNLMKAINTGGTIHALEFCQTRAYHLTDSMARELNASIVRRTDKPRNPKNQASEEELQAIFAFSEALENEQEMKPIVKEEGNSFLAYYPILSNDMCLQCHGEIGKEVKPETAAKIKDLYPNDKAIGYKNNQVRGIWVVKAELPEGL